MPSVTPTPTPIPQTTLTLSRDVWNTASLASSVDADVTSSRTWTVSSSDPTWLTFDSMMPPNRIGDGSFRINATANTGISARTGTITVSAIGAPNRTIAVVQSAPVATGFTVTFEANGGTVNPTTRSVASGDIVGTLPTPTRPGHTFTGWFTTQTGGMMIDSNRVITRNETFWARWTINNYTVTFNVNGGTGTPAPRVIQFRRPVGPLPPSPTRVGHTFLGWFISPTGGYRLTSNTLVTGDITYWAMWTPQDLTVTFNPNGGTLLAPSTRSVPNGAAIGDLPNASRNGYTLRGWFTQATGGIQINANRNIHVNTTFFAQWDRIEANTFTITLNPNGGTVNPQSVTRAAGALAGTLPTPIRTGHAFMGWYTTIGNVRILSSTVINSNIAVSARWQSINIIFNSNGGAAINQPVRPITQGSTLGTMPLAPRRQGVTFGHRFVGWFTHPTGGLPLTATTVVGTSSITAYARWECNVALWPTRIRYEWFRLNSVPVITHDIEIQLALESGMANWNNRNQYVRFYQSAGGNLAITQRSTGDYFGTYRTLVRTPGVPGSVNSFLVTICIVNTTAHARNHGHNINNVMSSVMAHELAHAVGLRDGRQRDDHPTLLGGSHNASLMNSGRNRNIITGPTSFDIDSVRLIYD